ncbi:MAG: hypothetical protein ACOC9N_02370 [Gemmatimonadota bacterium]
MTEIERGLTADFDPPAAETGADGGGPGPVSAGLATILRRIGIATRLLGVILLIAVGGLVATGRAQATIGAFVAPAGLIGLGQLLYAAERPLREKGLPPLSTLTGYAFIGAGIAMVIGGLVLVVDDPAGFALAAFGLVFVGAGHLARRIFSPPEGKRAVRVSPYEADIRDVEGRVGTRRQATIIHVDEDATAEEVRAAKEDWLRERWANRPDWVAGRIDSEDERGAGVLHLAVVLWSAFALGAAGMALFMDDATTVRNVAVGAALVAGGFVVRAVRRRMRLAKFGGGHLVLAHSPAYLGGVLDGEVESGVPVGDAPADGFRVRLRCVHRWEETSRAGSRDGRRTYRRRDVLWEDVRHTRGRAIVDDREHGDPDARLAIPLNFRLPADRPATTLGGSGEGIAWEVEITAAMPGLDYRAVFEVPVFPAGVEPWSSATKA